MYNGISVKSTQIPLFLGSISAKFARGISFPKISYTFGKNPFVFLKNPSKLRINLFVLKKSRTLFQMSEMPPRKFVCHHNSRPTNWARSFFWRPEPVSLIHRPNEFLVWKMRENCIPLTMCPVAKPRKNRSFFNQQIHVSCIHFSIPQCVASCKENALKFSREFPINSAFNTD